MLIIKQQHVIKQQYGCRCRQVRGAAAAVRITQDDGTGTGIVLGFGAPQGTDVRAIRRGDLAGTGSPLNHQAVANYIAK